MKKWRVKKLSTALRQALDDLRKVERSKRYVVDMDFYHGPNLDGTCSVCLAGARMVGLGAYRLHALGPSYFDDHTRNMLWAMDSLRQGLVFDALYHIGAKPNPKYRQLDREHVYYHEDKKLWWKQMRKLHRDLVKAGL